MYLDFNYPPAVPTDTDENRTNWAMKRVGIATNGDSWPNVTGIQELLILI